jgi:hypothetical protein
VKKLSLKFALLGAVFIAASHAWAHSDMYFDSHASPHGGQMRMAGPYHLELVAGASDVTVYVTSHTNKEISTAGGEGKAVVKSESGETTIMLSEAGTNMLKGKGDFTLGPTSTVVIFVKLREQEAQGATFTPLKPMMPSDHHEHHEHHE